MAHFNHILHKNVCQHYLTDEGLLNIISAGCGQLVKILITLEPHGKLSSDQILNACIYLYQHFPVTGMQNDDKA